MGKRGEISRGPGSGAQRAPRGPGDEVCPTASIAASAQHSILNTQNFPSRTPGRPLGTGQRTPILAGVDEAGRGPLAGPVVAAAVILPEGFDLTGVGDSKKLTAAMREVAFERLMAEAIVGVGIIHAEEIDRINILRATHRAMRLAVEALAQYPEKVQVDGLPVAGLHENCEAIVKGDSLCPAISAASIIAKVTRDRMMREYHQEYPQYGFDRHKGYPTKDHLTALSEHGPCSLHRRSFAPVFQLAMTFEDVP